MVRLCALPDDEAAALSGRHVSIRDDVEELVRRGRGDDKYELQTLRLVRAP